MILKNPDKLLRQFIPSATGNLIWCATNVSVRMDDEITYIFEFHTQIPVKSSPNQQYYSMTRAKNCEVKLKLFGDTYEIFCEGETQRGYCTDIDTLDKFIHILIYLLPNTY
jgi:hypothetical protein